MQDSFGSKMTNGLSYTLVDQHIIRQISLKNKNQKRSLCDICFVYMTFIVISA